MAQDENGVNEEEELEVGDNGDEEQAHWYGFEEDVDEVRVDSELAILPLRGVAVFPAAILPLLISRESSLALVEDALVGDRVIGLVAQKFADEESPGAEDLHKRGCAARILKMLKYPDGSVRILVQGLRRFEIKGIVKTDPYLKAEIDHLADINDEGLRVQALKQSVVQSFSRFVELTPHLPNELQVVVINIKHPGKIADLVAANLNIPLEEKQELLEQIDVGERLSSLGTTIAREIELLELGQKIQGEVQSELHKNQREFYLRQQLKAIQKELGETDSRTNENELLRRRIQDAKLPEEAQEAADNELNRLGLIPPESAEHSVVRTYLEWLADLPWQVSTRDNLDLRHAQQILDTDHYGLDKIKERVLEFLAVRQLRKTPRGPILCFVGPPGVGKTSLGRSIARAMGRKFYRLSLGGVRDEAEIRGHRRTYVGAMPGRVIQGLKSAGSNNPVFMLDEIDKLGSDVRGDPSAALLEVLDPEQNNTFRDHYLDVPMDLSGVLFVTTANMLDTVPPALRDRMEVLELSGYSEEEKLEIARRHLVPKQIEENGLSPQLVSFSTEALTAIIRGHTRESGLRNLERELGKVCRKIARKVTEGARDPVVIGTSSLHDYLGQPKHLPEIAENSQKAGIAIGLAWTPHGGDILFVEASCMKGKKGMTLTGQLGDVMKESAQAALTFLRSNAEQYGIAPEFFEVSDIHIHVPAGAIPKDGPSAGVTMLSALASVLTGRPLADRLAMTGEITLRGTVLPVGGIKEKVLAARTAGIQRLILPARNKQDYEEIAPELRKQFTVTFVEEVSQVLAAALKPAPDKTSAAPESVSQGSRHAGTQPVSL